MLDTAYIESGLSDLKMFMVNLCQSAVQNCFDLLHLHIVYICQMMVRLLSILKYLFISKNFIWSSSGIDELLDIGADRSVYVWNFQKSPKSRRFLRFWSVFGPWIPGHRFILQIIFSKKVIITKSYPRPIFCQKIMTVWWRL